LIQSFADAPIPTKVRDFQFSVLWGSSLREADGSNFEVELWSWLTGRFDCNVLDGESFKFFGFDFKHALSPRAVFDLAVVLDRGGDIEDVGSDVIICQHLQLAVGVEAVVGDVLSNLLALQTQHLDLTVRGSVLHSRFIIDVLEQPHVSNLVLFFHHLNRWHLGPDTGFVVGGVAVDEHSILGGSGVGVNPVIA